ncbi:unnamed protein product, partial [Didymodactylos carnosus]
YSLQQVDSYDDDDDNDTEEDQEQLSSMNMLKEMKILPLQHQSHLVSINDYLTTPIFFPLEKSAKYSKHLKILLQDLPTLDEQLFTYIEQVHPQRLDNIKRLLKNLGILEIRNIHDIYRQHILPTLKNDKEIWRFKSDSTLMSYFVCVFHYVYKDDPDKFDLKTFQTVIQVKTIDGKFHNPLKTVIHLTKAYGCDYSLEHLSHGQDYFTFIHDDYLKEFGQDLLQYKYKWLTFLKDLGIQEFLNIEQIDHKYSSIYELELTSWSHCQMDLLTAIGTDCECFTIKDYTCKEFDSLLDKAKDDQQYHSLCQNLLLLFNKLWRTITYYFDAQVHLTRNNKHLMIFKSTFSMKLKQREWIPATAIQRKNGNMRKEIQMKQSSDVYYLSQNNFFQQYFPHLDSNKIQLTEMELVTNILEFKQQIKQSDMLVLLLHWTSGIDIDKLQTMFDQTTTNDLIVPCPSSLLTAESPYDQCVDSCQNMSKIYKFIGSNYLSKFILWPLILIPSKTTLIGGQFVFPKDVYWSDSTNLLQKYSSLIKQSRHSLNFYYGNDVELQMLFLDTFHIDVLPSVQDYLPLIDYFIQLNELNKEQLIDLWKLFEIIIQMAFNNNDEKKLEIIDIFHSRSCIPCWSIDSISPNSINWVKVVDKPLISHDKDIAALFQDILFIIKLP